MKIPRITYIFAITTLSVALSLPSTAKQPNLKSSDPSERAMGAQQIYKTGVYSKEDIDLLVNCLGDYTRLIPSEISTPVSGPYSRDQRETSPSDEAEKAIIWIGKPAVPSLLAALKEGGGHKSYRAAKVLGDMREPSALTRLKQLANGGEYGRTGVSGADDEYPLAIARIGKSAEFEFLRNLLGRAEIENRVNSGLLEAIGYSEDERSISILNEYLKSGDRYRKMGAVVALGHTRSPKAVDLLLPYVNFQDLHLKEYSRNSLKQLGRSDLIPKD